MRRIIMEYSAVARASIIQSLSGPRPAFVRPVRELMFFWLKGGAFINYNLTQFLSCADAI